MQNTSLKNPRALQMFIWQRGWALAQSVSWQLPVPESRSHPHTKCQWFLDLTSDISLAKPLIISLVLVLECYCYTDTTIDLLVSSYRPGFHSWCKGAKVYSNTTQMFEYLKIFVIFLWRTGVAQLTDVLCYWGKKANFSSGIEKQELWGADVRAFLRRYNSLQIKLAIRS